MSFTLKHKNGKTIFPYYSNPARMNDQEAREFLKEHRAEIVKADRRVTFAHPEFSDESFLAYVQLVRERREELRQAPKKSAKKK